MRSFNENAIPYPSSMKVHALILPVSYEDSYKILKAKIDEINPDVVIGFGLASNRDTIDLETTAMNIMDRRTADNTGNKPTSLHIIPNGEDAYVSTLPLSGLMCALKEAKLPAEQSNSAGDYVCNYLFYNLMKDNQDTLRLCGFIHVPPEEKLKFSDLQKTLSVVLKYLDY